MTLFLKKNLYFRTNKSSLAPFLVTSYFATHPITSQNIGEGACMDCMDRLSPQILEGNVPPVPPKTPPVVGGR